MKIHTVHNSIIKKKLGDPKLSYLEQFFKWLENNRAFYDEFAKYTFRIMETGKTHYSSDAIFHVLRYNLEVAVYNEDIMYNEEGKPIKVRDGFTAYMARYFMYQHPEHGPYIDAFGEYQHGFFHARPIRDARNKWGDEWWKVRVLGQHKKAA